MRVEDVSDEEGMHRKDIFLLLDVRPPIIPDNILGVEGVRGVGER